MDPIRIKTMLVPAAWALVVAQAVLLAVQGWAGAQRGAGFDTHAAMSALVALVLGLAVCWAQVGRTARAVLVAALVVTGAGLIGAVAVAVLVFVAGTSSVPGDAVASLVRVLAVQVVSVVALIVLVRLFAFVTRVPKGAEPPVPTAPELPGAPASAESPETAIAPVWRPDRAAGAHWHSAGAAAAGAAAADWGRPGERTGWAAAERPVAGNDAAASGNSVGDSPEVAGRRVADEPARPLAPGEARRPAPSWTPLPKPTSPTTED